MSAVDVTEPRSDEFRVYLLAAERDEEICAEIRRAMAPLTLHDEVPIRVLDDFSVGVAEDREARKAQLLDSHVVLALMSSDFINDKQIYERGQHVIERYNRHEVILVTVLVRSCYWEITPMAAVPVLPQDHEPIMAGGSWDESDVTAIVKDVHRSLSALVELDLTDRFDVRDEAVVIEEAPAEVASSAIEIEADNAPPTAVPPDTSAPTVATTPAPSPAPSRPPVSWSLNVAEHEPITKDWWGGYYLQVMVRRFGAALIDSVLLFVIMVLVLLPFAPSDDEELGNVALFLGFGVTYLVIMPLLEWRFRGSPGKRLIGLQVTDEHGRAMSWGQAFVRSLLRFVIYYGFILVVPLLLQIWRFRRSKKLFHDEVTKTVVSLR